MSEIDEFDQKCRTRFGVPLIFRFILILFVVIIFRVLPKESNSLVRAFEITLVYDQEAASDHPNLELCKRIPDRGDVTSDGLDDWQ